MDLFAPYIGVLGFVTGINIEGAVHIVDLAMLTMQTHFVGGQAHETTALFFMHSWC